MKRKIISYILAGTIIAVSPISTLVNMDQSVAFAWQTELPSGTKPGSGPGQGMKRPTDFVFDKEGSTIKDGEIDVPKEALLMLQFSNNVSGEEVLKENAEKISVTDSKGNPIEITITSVPESISVEDVFEYRRFLSINMKEYKEGETYTINVLPGIKAKNGTVMNEGFKISFTTAKSENIDSDIILNKNSAYLNGYDDNSIRPDIYMTRAEVAKVLKVITANTLLKDKPKYFTDISENQWFKEYVDFVSKADFMNGYSDGSFRPDEYMTRAEFVTAMSKFIDKKEGETSFTDISEHWAKKNIESFYNNGLIKGYDNNSFKPEQYIKRSEVVTIINKILGKDIILDEYADQIKTFIDLDINHWAYKDIISATLNIK